MSPKFPGTNVDLPRAAMPSESEATPRNERVLQVVKEAEGKRLALEERVEKLEEAVEKIGDEQKAGNRRTTIAVAVIGLVGVVITAALAYWGQVQAIAAGARQANVGAAQAVQSATPSTESTYREGFRAGAKSVVDEQLARLQANPPPLQKQPDTVAANGRRR